MRTTVTLDDDVAAAVEQERRRSGSGVSEVVNKLVRAGLVERPSPKPYRHQTTNLGLKFDVNNVAEVLELLDGP